MLKQLKETRVVEKNTTTGKKVLTAIGLLMLGIILGVLSKYLDCTASNELPYIVQVLEVRQFFDRFAIWIFIALSISVYSNSPIEAGINVFVFFLGMVSSYYLYSTYVAGFFPRIYALIWFGITAISPLMAYVCWYAKGNDKIAIVLSALILAVLFNITFAYGWGYFEPYSILEAVVFVCGVFVMKRTTFSETIKVTVGGMVVAGLMNMVIPFVY